MLAIIIIVIEKSKRKGNFLCSIISPKLLGNMVLNDASKNNFYFLMALTANNLMKSMTKVSESVTEAWKRLVKKYKSPGWVPQSVVASSHAPKGDRFNSQSGRIPTLQV